MSSYQRTHASKLEKEKLALSAIEINSPANVIAQKPVASASKPTRVQAGVIVSTSNNSQANKPSYSATVNAISINSARRKALVAKLKDKEYRDAYVRATTVHGLAHQIRANRELRNMSQQALAEQCGGKTTQAVISRLEDPAYGKYTLNTILKIASALDVAALVRFVPYSKFLLETAEKSVLSFYAKSYLEDNLQSSQALVTLFLNENQYIPYGSPRPVSHEAKTIAAITVRSSASNYAFVKSK